MVERCTEAAVGDLADVPSQGPRESPLQTHGVGGGGGQTELEPESQPGVEGPGEGWRWGCEAVGEGVTGSSSLQLSEKARKCRRELPPGCITSKDGFREAFQGR